MKRLLVSFVLSVFCIRPVYAGSQTEAQTDRESALFNRWWQVEVPGHPVPTGGIKGPVRKLIRGELKIANKFGKWEEESQAPWMFTTFNAHGAVIEDLHFSWQFNSPHPCTHYVYTYDTQGHKVQDLWDSTEGQPVQQLCHNERYSIEQRCYDAEGHPIGIEEICRRSETLLYKPVSVDRNLRSCRLGR